jgi:hypothetical protein
MNWISALLLGIAIVVGAALIGGRFTASPPVGETGVYVLDRWTGDIRFCITADGKGVCGDVQNLGRPFPAP